jgi:hypothetical protein
MREAAVRFVPPVDRFRGLVDSGGMKIKIIWCKP